MVGWTEGGVHRIWRLRWSRSRGGGVSGGAGEYEGVVGKVFDGMCKPTLSIAGINGEALEDSVLGCKIWLG